jgi:site-specific DNA-methyltransferase (adenine-specific)
MRIKLTVGEINELMNARVRCRGRGGFQNLLFQIWCHLDDGSGEIDLNPVLAERIHRYAFAYQRRTWRKSLRSIFRRTLRGEFGPVLQIAKSVILTLVEFSLEQIDCVLGMRRLDAQSIDIVVTSPPYNLGIKYRNYEDTRTRDEYLTWSLEWATEVKRVLKDDGSFFLNLGASPSNPLIPHELVVELKRLFTLQNTFHWIKSITVETKEGQQISAGHFKPLRGERYVNDCHEYIFHLTKSGEVKLNRTALGVPYSDKSNIARWAHTNGRDVRCRGNNWFIPYRTIVSRMKERPHPATFPVELAVNCIRIHGCTPDSVMLDPFVGIGHSAIAAKRCSLSRFIGFDIDVEYLRVARTALESGVIKPTAKLLQEPRRPIKKQKGEGTLFDFPNGY